MAGQGTALHGGSGRRGVQSSANMPTANPNKKKAIFRQPLRRIYSFVSRPSGHDLHVWNVPHLIRNFTWSGGGEREREKTTAIIANTGAAGQSEQKCFSEAINRFRFRIHNPHVNGRAQV